MTIPEAWTNLPKFIAVNGGDAGGLAWPSHLKLHWLDEQGRRCSQVIADMPHEQAAELCRRLNPALLASSAAPQAELIAKSKAWDLMWSRAAKTRAVWLLEGKDYDGKTVYFNDAGGNDTHDPHLARAFPTAEDAEHFRACYTLRLTPIEHGFIESVPGLPSVAEMGRVLDEARSRFADGDPRNEDRGLIGFNAPIPDKSAAPQEAQIARLFNVQSGPAIPWSMIAPHEAQAKRNHNQDLETLHRRGGLFPCEALHVLKDIEWSYRDVESQRIQKLTKPAAIAELKALIDAEPLQQLQSMRGEREQLREQADSQLAELVQWRTGQRSLAPSAERTPAPLGGSDQP